MQNLAASLIIDELEKNLKDIKIVSYEDIYENKQKEISIDFDLNFINKILGTYYEESFVLNIIKNLGIKLEDNKLIIPFWRKDLNFKADIAEEIARIA
ncbi:MAG: hypothetical protein P1U46_00415 [Patescibacteria group bacterium]|nr:hypothetical protein [Patescibacteria group bacterium]